MKILSHLRQGTLLSPWLPIPLTAQVELYGLILKKWRWCCFPQIPNAVCTWNCILFSWQLLAWVIIWTSLLGTLFSWCAFDGLGCVIFILNSPGLSECRLFSFYLFCRALCEGRLSQSSVGGCGTWEPPPLPEHTSFSARSVEGPIFNKRVRIQRFQVIPQRPGTVDADGKENVSLGERSPPGLFPSCDRWLLSWRWPSPSKL